MVLFSNLEERDFDLIHQPIDDLNISAGSFLYRQGDPGKYLFTLRTGLLKLVKYTPEGNQRIVRLLKAGDVAGLEAIIGSPYQHNAVILHEAQVCRLPLAVPQLLDRETPRLHKELMSRWQRALDEADIFLTELSTGNARTRMVRLLIHMLNPEQQICFLPGREDLGAMLGITTETASRIIAALKREGILNDLGHDMVHCELNQLEKLAEE